MQMCQRKSRAAGSRTTEWQIRGQPNRPLMHCVSLTCSTGLDIQDWMGPVRLSGADTDMQLHSCIAQTPHNLGVVHLCEVMLCGLFSSTVPLELLPLTDMSDDTATRHATSPTASGSASIGLTVPLPKISSSNRPCLTLS